MEYKITGRVVTKKSKRGVPNLVVRAFDKDLIYSDLLGQVRTNDDGEFEILYSGDFFQELFDKNPDLYLSVKDANDEAVLYTSEDAVRTGAGKVEHFEVEVDVPDPGPREKLSPDPKAGLNDVIDLCHAALHVRQDQIVQLHDEMASIEADARAKLGALRVSANDVEMLVGAVACW